MYGQESFRTLTVYGQESFRTLQCTIKRSLNSFTLSVSFAIFNGNEEEVEDEIEDIDPHQPVGDDEDTEISFAFPFTLSNRRG